MRVSREQAEENRVKVVEAASRLFRERGLAGTNIAAVMREAGLTHGGFYAQFESKEQLEAEALAAAFSRSSSRWRRWSEGEKAPLKAIVSRYLTRAHAENPAHGCALAALAEDVGRSSSRALKRSFAEGLRELAEILTGANKGSEKARREKALAQLSTMVGAMVLARAIDDRKLGDEILDAARAFSAD